MLETQDKRQAERIGLNSLRDFYLDKWQGKVVTGIEEANKYVSFTANNLSERSILKKLKAGEFFVAFVKDYKIGEQIKSEFAHLKEISFRIIPVEMDLGLVYFYIDRDKGNAKSTYIAAELAGLNKLLREAGFNQEFVRAWMECRIADRLICIEEVNLVLNDPNLTEAFLCYSPHFNRKDYENWKNEFKIELKIRKGHRYLISRVVNPLAFLLKCRVY
jgi:hypothetical protein